MRKPRTRNTVADSLAVLATLALAAFVLTMLALARSVLIPLALAGLLTFLLSPIVTRLERAVGRIAAVLVVAAMIFVCTGALGWVLTNQLIDLATKLPDYRENIVGKIQSFELPPGLKAFQTAFDDIRGEFPSATGSQPVVVVPPADADGEGSASVVVQPAPPVEPASKPSRKPPSKTAPPEPNVRLEVVTSARPNPVELVRRIVSPLMGPLGMAALVMLLVVVMLLQRDDLRRRIIRLLGQGHISSTTRALDDASQRVSRYLLMQVVINVSYGVPVGIGLWMIGVPNAALWGGLATVLRFVPYVGPWIAAIVPVALSFAVSPDWTMPLLTIGLFLFLETISNNVMEPWLYGATTGVSPIALIIAAVFWTWLWGPVGLVLATPLTVCLVVMGRHVPQLSFLSVLLSDEDALTPAEDLYQRLLTPGEHDEMELVEQYVNAKSVVELYDDVVIPVLVEAENDTREDSLSREMLASVHQSIRDIVQDLGARLDTHPPLAGGFSGSPTPESCRILCLPARAERDELAAAMLAHLLQFQGCHAWGALAPVRPGRNDILELVEKSELDALVIGIVAPSAVLHARFLYLSLRNRFPDLRIVVGLWGMGDSLAPAVKRLRDAGATVAFSLADAVEAALPRKGDDQQGDARLHGVDTADLRTARSA
jgi:predicted PurR-regulated permease PerM